MGVDNVVNCDASTDLLEAMRAQLARRRFRDWKLSMVEGSESQAHMVMVYTAPCSRTGVPTEFKVVARLDLTDDLDRFHSDVTRALKQADDHEFDEANQLDGKPITDPHQDIERWHCDCGCLGPKRADHPVWKCTKCGKEHEEAPLEH